MKKITKAAIPFALVLPLGVLAGCGGGGGGGTAGTITCWINEGNKWTGNKKDTAWKMVEEYAGIKLSIDGATHNADYYTTLNPKVNTGETPDIMFTVPSAQGNAWQNWIKQGIVCNLDELMAEKPGEYPYLEKLFNKSHYKNIQYCDDAGDSGHYMIPFLSSRSGWTIYYRSDWLINIGYTKNVGGHIVARTPTTMDEFQDVMKKFTENDPDNNGVDDTYGMSPGGEALYFNPLYHAFGCTTDFDLDNNDKAIYERLTPEWKNFTAWAADMFKKGYIDPGFAANTAGTGDREAFYNGKCGILITNGESHVQWIVKGVENIFGKDKVVVGDAPVGTATVGKEGCKGFSDWGGWWGGFSISSDCPNKHGVLKFFDYINSPAGNTLFRWGVEGQHWEMKNDEKTAIIAGREDEPVGTYYEVTDENDDVKPLGTHEVGSHFQYEVSWNGDDLEGVPEASNIPYKYKSIFNDTVENCSLSGSRLTNVTGWPSAYTTKIKKIKDATNTYTLEAICGRKNTTTDWDALLSQVEERTYEWSSVQAMIEQVARDLEIIK